MSILLCWIIFLLKSSFIWYTNTYYPFIYFIIYIFQKLKIYPTSISIKEYKGVLPSIWRNKLLASNSYRILVSILKLILPFSLYLIKQETSLPWNMKVRLLENNLLLLKLSSKNLGSFALLRKDLVKSILVSITRFLLELEKIV